MKDLSVIIVNYNGKELLRRCLFSVKNALEGLNAEIVVVDNGSGDGSGLMVKEEFPEVIQILNPVNAGFPAGFNDGVRASSGRFICELNNDTEVDSACFKILLNKLKEDGTLVAAAPKKIYHSGAVEDAGAFFSPLRVDAVGVRNSEAGRPRLIDYTGTGYMMRRDIFQAFDGFDERFGPGYFEETDLFWRIKRAGLRVAYEPKAVLVHYGGQTSGMMEKKDYFDLIEKNRIRFMAVNYPLPWLLLRFFLEPAHLISCLLKGRAVSYAVALSGAVRGIAEINTARVRRREAAETYRSKAGYQSAYRDSALVNAYDSVVGGGYESRMEMSIVSSVLGCDNKRLLDIACGTGRIIEAAAPECAGIFGIDSSVPMLKEASKKIPRVRLCCADACKIPFKEKSLDVVTMFRLFINLHRPDREAAIGEAWKALSPGGVLIFNIHLNSLSAQGILASLFCLKDSRFGERMRSAGYFSAKKILMSHGFSIENVHGFRFFPNYRWFPFQNLMAAVLGEDVLMALEKAVGKSFLKYFGATLVITARKKN